jgi:hypothetical protein
VRRAGVAGLAFALVAAGCGTKSGSGNGGTLEALWNRPGQNVGMIQGTSDYARGRIRVSFLIVGRDARPVERPRAHFWVASSRSAKPFAETTARLEQTGVPEAQSSYVAHVTIPRAGRYWAVAEPIGGKRIQALGALGVRAHSSTPAVGSRAYPSRTPTLASVGGPAARITTSEPPDTALLRYSVAGSLAAHAPFVLIFATPAFCTSRTCGPMVDVVDAVRKRFEGRGVRFIHVEIYRRNNPSLGTNMWVHQWRLPSEPWVFLVGRDGRIKAKLGGPFSVAELSTAVRQELLPRS